MGRDPRVDPKFGDEIKQANTGYILQVTGSTDGRVCWKQKTRYGWGHDNCWSLKGWRDVVAKNSVVLKSA
jgi:hypothetical protein